MAITLHVGLFEHPLSYGMTEVVIQRSSLNDSKGRPIGHRDTWSINGVVAADGDIAIKAAIDAVEAAYVSGVDVKLVNDGAVVLQSLLNATAKDGTRCVTPPSFPVGKGEGQFSTNRKFSAVFEGDYYDGGLGGDSDIIWLEESINYGYDQHNKCTRTVSGKLRTIGGVAASSKVAARDPSTPAGYNRTGRTVHIVDIEDTDVDYSFVDSEYWDAYPTGATGGSYSDSIRKDGYGRVVRTLSGSFTGVDAAGAAASVKLVGANLLLEEEVTTDVINGSVSFSYTYLSSDSTTLLYWEETTTLTPAGQAFVLRPVLGGATPVKQSTVLLPAKATQQGSAIGKSPYPSFPSYKWPSTSVKVGGVVKEMGNAKRARDNSYTEYPIRWSYSFEFEDTPTFYEPSAPPVVPT
jgi:hypothetical protein